MHNSWVITSPTVKYGEDAMYYFKKTLRLRRLQKRRPILSQMRSTNTKEKIRIKLPDGTMAKGKGTLLSQCELEGAI